MKVTDGTGTGFETKVDSSNRLHTFSVTRPEIDVAILSGLAYNISTGLISGIAGDSALLYFYNGEDPSYFIQSVAIGSFDGVTHTDDPYITIIRNPTGGDLITDQTAADIVVNRDFGSSRELVDSFAYKGKNGGTVTGGSTLGIFQYSGGSRLFFDVNVNLPKGASIGIKTTLNASAGSCSMYAALIGYQEEIL